MFNWLRKRKKRKRKEEKKLSQKLQGLGIAIVGNMNVGKTTLFNQMCGSKVRNVNYPGSTVSIVTAKIKGVKKYAFDTPGTCSIFSLNEDESVSRDILLSFRTKQKVEGAILVADAKNLKRSISLTLQYAEYGIPMLLDINMVDEAESRGISIDYGKLSNIFKIDVCPSVATERIGISEIKSKLDSLRTPQKTMKYPVWVEEYINIVETLLSESELASTRGIALLLLADDRSTIKYVEKTFGDGMSEQLLDLATEYRKKEKTPFCEYLTNLYNQTAEKIVKQVQISEPRKKRPYIEKFGDLCTQPSTGIPIAVVILALMFLFIGSFGATLLADSINNQLFQRIVIPWITKIIEPIQSVFIKDMLIDPDIGIIPTGIFLAIGIVLPVLFCFYVFFGFLEDSGYLPRISVLLDRLFRVIGLNGKGVIPLTLGFSCITMALLTTRMLDSKKEKILASFLLMFALPCAPLLGSLFIILEKMPVSAIIFVFGIMIFQLFMAGMIANWIIPGKRSMLIMEIPPMRVPNPFQIIKRSALRTYSFMKEALPVFIFASFLVFIFDKIGGLLLLEHALRPLTGTLLGLPERSVEVFIKTMIRRENGATELFHLAHLYDNVGIVVNIIIMMFLVPCVNAIIVLFKERGLKVATIIVCTVTIYAICIGTVVNHACRFLGVTF